MVGEFRPEDVGKMRQQSVVDDLTNLSKPQEQNKKNLIQTVTARTQNNMTQSHAPQPVPNPGLFPPRSQSLACCVVASDVTVSD